MNMDEQNKNSNGMEQNTPLNPIPSQGPVVGIIIVIIVLIVGAFYFFTRLSMPAVPPADTATTTSGDGVFPPTRSSDDPDAIAADLEAENFNEIDAELDRLETEGNQ